MTNHYEMDDDIDLDAIPHDEIEMPTEWISEQSYPTKEQLEAFIDGLNYADDIDLEYGNPFKRGESWVVRIKVGGY